MLDKSFYPEDHDSDACTHAACPCATKRLYNLAELAEQVIQEAKMDCVHDSGCVDPNAPSNQFEDKPLWFEYVSPPIRAILDEEGFV